MYKDISLTGGTSVTIFKNINFEKHLLWIIHHQALSTIQRKLTSKD